FLSSNSTKITIMQNKVLIIGFLFVSGVASAQTSEFNFPPTFKNVFSYDLLGPAYSRTTISYERLICDGKFGVEIPFSNGYFATDIDDIEIDWSIGVEFKHYLSP